MAELDCPFPTPPISLFTKVLSKESNWYELAMFLDVPTNELDHIERTYNKYTLMRLYIEVYKCLESLNLCRNWERIATSLQDMGNQSLAEEIKSKYVIPSNECIPVSSSGPHGDRDIYSVEIKSPILNKIAKDYEKYSERLINLLRKAKVDLKKSNVDMEALQDMIDGKCGPALLSPTSLSAGPVAVRFDIIFETLKKSCSILNFRALVFIVENLLQGEKKAFLCKKLSVLKKTIDKNFKSSVRMGQLVDLIKEKQAISGNDKKVKLKVIEFWEEFTIKQFEKVVADILRTLYEVTSQIRVTKGCICISGIIPDHIDANKLAHSSNSSEEFEFADNMGVLFLRIESPSTSSPPIEIYKFVSTEKPRTLEEAISRCKNARAKDHLKVIEEENFEWKRETKKEHYKTRLEKPIQIITDIKHPCCIAFSNNGDMFVTSEDDHFIHVHVYNKSGNKNTIFGPFGPVRLDRSFPRNVLTGIDIIGDMVYVCDSDNHMILNLTTRGEFIGTFGEKGSGIGQFNKPHDVKISPEGKVYVSDTGNNIIKVFNSECSITHVIDGYAIIDGDDRFPICPRGIAFDLSSNLHVADVYSSLVLIFTPSGQFIRRYGGSLGYPIDIAIDSSGYSIVTDAHNTISVYDPRGELIHSRIVCYHPFGITVSPTDGGVWVADTCNNRLVKY